MLFLHRGAALRDTRALPSTDTARQDLACSGAGKSRALASLSAKTVCRVATLDSQISRVRRGPPDCAPQLENRHRPRTSGRSSCRTGRLGTVPSPGTASWLPPGATENLSSTLPAPAAAVRPLHG